jgi:DNA-binding transcriptional LysR family regulator
MVGLDVRSLRGLLIDGHGWTVLPEYLCRDHLAAGELEEIPGTAPDQNHLSYHLLWAPAALRQPRVAHVRHALIWRLYQQ